MPIKPENSYVLFQYAGSTSTLYCEDISFSQVSEPFERPEYKRDIQRKALESNGTAPLIVQLIYGIPAQITSTGLTTTTPRSLLPDDGVLANIFQKLFATRYVLKGNTSTNSDTELMFTWSTIHRQLQDQFVAHSKYAQAAVSIQELAALEAGNFNYLTSTGLTLVSGAVGTINNLLIRDFVVHLDYYTVSDGTNLYVWEATVDSITILSDLP